MYIMKKIMNITINITKTPLEESNVEKRSLRTKIEKYLHRVRIVEDSKTLKLLRQTIVLLTINSSSQTISNKDSKLYDILQRMQTIIEQLQKNENSTSKSKSYTNVVRFVVESIAMSKRVEKRVEKFFNSKTIKQIREFTINIVNDEERKKLKEMIIKDIMKKMRVEKIRDITRLESDALRIQTKSTKIKNALQKQSEMIRKIVVSITSHSRIYVVRVNEIRIEHIDENNQTNFITYLQKNNARLHSSLIIKKMIWSQRIIRKKKKYSILHIEIVIVKMTNRLLFENLLKAFEMKKCERFIKNCILRQCFNCQKYDHIDKHCKTAVVCNTCAKEHRTSDCDFNIIDKHKKCDACENREHIAWVSNCKVRIKKKKKIDLTRRIRMRLYFAEESQTTREIFKFAVAKFIELETLLHEWKVIVSKKRKIVANLKSETSFESFSTSVQIAENNNITNSRDRSSWANVEIMNSKNMKRELSRNSMNRFRFVSESSSKFKNVNASIVVNTMIDFDSLWKTKSLWSYYSTTFETRECARWFFCWSTTTFRTLMSSLFKSFDEISSYRSRWALVKRTFIYSTDSTRIRKYVFTSTISWTRTTEMSNTLRSTSAHWRWKSTI